MPYHDRQDAGRALANSLRHRKIDHPIVIALLRGGIPVGFEVARKLGSPLDILVVRKIGAPGNPEYGLGAITEDQYYYLDSDAMTALGLRDEELAPIIEHESQEVSRRIHRFRHGKPALSVAGRNVILVDDGLATGVTAIAAAHLLRERGARSITLAVPVCASESAARLEQYVDEVICLEKPERFFAVGLWYRDFAQVSDTEVEEMIAHALPWRQIESQEPAALPSSGLGWLQEVQVNMGDASLPGTLAIPTNAIGIAIFAHGSGSSRMSPRNRQVAEFLNRSGIGTLLFDLLTEEESLDRANVFDIPSLARRLVGAVHWSRSQAIAKNYPLGFFGASTGAGAALWAAAELGREITAVVSRGGRPDLAIPRLPEVIAPTLLIVGGEDAAVIELNEEAQRSLTTSQLVVIPGATHLFEEPGALDAVSRHAMKWFTRYFQGKHATRKRTRAA